MKCSQCDREINENVKYCKYCGTKVEQIIDEVEEPNLFENIEETKIEPVVIATITPESNTEVELIQPVFSEGTEPQFEEPVSELKEKELNSELTSGLTNELSNEPINELITEPTNELTNELSNEPTAEPTAEPTTELINVNIEEIPVLIEGNTMVKPTKKNNSKLLFISLIVVSVIALAAIILLLVNQIAKPDKVIVPTVSNKLDIYNLELTLPDDVKYKIDDGKLIITKNDASWEAAMVSTSKPYYQEVEDLSSNEKIFSFYSFTVEKESEMELNEKKRYVFEVTNKDQKTLIVYTTSPTDKNIVLQFYSKNNTYDYIQLNEVLNIIDKSIIKEEPLLIKDTRYVNYMKNK